MEIKVREVTDVEEKSSQQIEQELLCTRKRRSTRRNKTRGRNSSC